MVEETCQKKQTKNKNKVQSNNITVMYLKDLILVCWTLIFIIIFLVQTLKCIIILCRLQEFFYAQNILIESFQKLCKTLKMHINGQYWIIWSDSNPNHTLVRYKCTCSIWSHGQIVSVHMQTILIWRKLQGEQQTCCF